MATKRRTERPLLVAAISVAAAIVAGGLGLALALVSPESVVIGMHGRHDPRAGSARLADCLDCHVPFVGTPGSRCLSPGCHGELATGTPPRQGPAMPIRFHAALRAYHCGGCHVEHARDPEASRTAFAHALIPADGLGQCGRCHSGAGVLGHATTDGVPCDLCHELGQWRGTQMAHGRVEDRPCDLCHQSPEDPAHATVAGTCTDCHGSKSWSPVKE